MENQQPQNLLNHQINDHQLTNSHILVSAISGGLASLTVDLIQFPLDSIKTRIQASKGSINYVEKAQNVSKFKGVQSIASISHLCGFIFFMTYDKIKQILSTRNYNESISHLMAAAVGEISQNFFRNPFEVCKQQMQIGLNNTMRETFKIIYKTQGIQGFYAGYFSLLMREIPFSCIQFPIYEQLKRQSIRKKKQLTFIDTSINSIIAGAIGMTLSNNQSCIKKSIYYLYNQIKFESISFLQKINKIKLLTEYYLILGYSIFNLNQMKITQNNDIYLIFITGSLTTPMDVVKTRLMTDRNNQYKNTIDCVKQIYLQEGVAAFFKAIKIRTMTISMMGIVFFGSYEGFKQQFEKYLN